MDFTVHTILFFDYGSMDYCFLTTAGLSHINTLE
jgi:hypothetical protein